jgi:hypothetical protein
VFTDLLGDAVRVLGPDDPATLDARHELARWRGRAGDAAGAAAAFAELVADRSRVLGPEHPDTVKSAFALAHWQEQCGPGSRTVR